MKYFNPSFTVQLKIFAFFLLWNTSVFAALPWNTADSKVPSLAPMLEKTRPAVVNIAAKGKVNVANPLLNDPFFRFFFDIPNLPREQETESLGSGVIVDGARGLILTNHHVIEHATKIVVTLDDGRILDDVKVLGSDPASDIALIQMKAKNLVSILLADSSKLRVGDFVVAIGSPFGLKQTVTSGIVSALGRSGLGIIGNRGYEDFIQTDASINPGNSGGALVDLTGSLVGINTAIVAPSGGNVGIGFAIPINMAKSIMEQLLQYGNVKRGALGVSIQDLTPDLAKALNIQNLTGGALISEVEDGSAADKAGIKPGDIVLTMNGKAVENSSSLRNKIGLLRLGNSITLTLWRNGKVHTVRAELLAREESFVKGEDIHPRLAGASFGNVTIQGKKGKQVTVIEVDPESPAAEFVGLQEGDIIVSVNRRKVSTLGDMKAAAKNSRELLLNIQRGKQSFFIVIK
ncbi:MAG: DegQ family serine endoprotease [Gammaproteobacteria bacterium]|nr:DegQ family serine endoprotease [Gammaproteobacteria bacterium]